MDKQQRSLSNSFILGLVSGTLSGVLATLVGHPFDTMKVDSFVDRQPDETTSESLDCEYEASCS